jgi:hypothetical protein
MAPPHFNLVSRNVVRSEAGSLDGETYMIRYYLLTIPALLVASPCFAYVGPGVGLGVLGTLFGILAAIVLAVFGLFWYPLKRMFKKQPEVVEGSIPENDVGHGDEDLPE